MGESSGAGFMVQSWFFLDVSACVSRCIYEAKKMKSVPPLSPLQYGLKERANSLSSGFHNILQLRKQPTFALKGDQVRLPNQWQPADWILEGNPFFLPDGPSCNTCSLPAQPVEGAPIKPVLWAFSHAVADVPRKGGFLVGHWGLLRSFVGVQHACERPKYAAGKKWEGFVRWTEVGEWVTDNTLKKWWWVGWASSMESCVSHVRASTRSSAPTHSGLAGRESSDLPFPPPADPKPSSLLLTDSPNPLCLQPLIPDRCIRNVESKIRLYWMQGVYSAVGKHVRNWQELSQHLQPLIGGILENLLIFCIFLE